MASDYNRKKRVLRIAVGIAVLAILLLVGGVGTAAVPPPIITSITPTSGVAGMAITINGQNFGTNLGTVYFGDTPANLGQPNDDKGQAKWGNTKIVALVPRGIGTVQVSVKDSKGAKSEGVPFTYLDVPIVSQWRWPRDKATPIEGWGYDIYSSKDGGNHTGIDIWEEKNKIDTSVFAAADGIVVAKCPYGEKCIGFSTNDHNHRLYSVVIIAHRLSEETFVYSMYADMADELSSTPEPGERVYMGKTILGQTGRYIQYLDDDGIYKQRWISHVHFEIKNEPVLHNPDWDAHLPIWGYTNQGKTLSNYKSSPDYYGYNNPTRFINAPQPTAPILITAKDVTIPLTLSWEAVNEAKSETTYRIQISLKSDFKNIVVEKSGLTTTSVIVSDLDPDTLYWWRADAKNTGGIGPWSTVRSFTTGNKIPSFSTSGKINGAFALGISGVTMTFTKVSGSGTLPDSVQTYKDGNWFQSDFRSDTSYRVTPYKFGYTFTPSSLDFNNANTKLDFTTFTAVIVDENPKQTDGGDISAIIYGILKKATEIFNEYIRIPEAHSAPPTPALTYTPTITPTVLPILTPTPIQTRTPTLTPVITPTSTPLINTYELSNNGLQFIATHEGFISQLYNDAGGHCTIGYGHLVHTGPCNEGESAEFKDGIIQTRGIEILNSDVQSAVKAVNSKVIVQLNQNQFDAMVSFTFNMGTGGFSGSTVLSVLNAGKYENVPTELNRYVKSGGIQIQGLVNRRKDEGVLFMNPIIPIPTLNDPYAGIRAVFGQQWTPTQIFVTRGLVNQGVYGAVNINGGIDVYTIGPGGTKETPESYYQKFGTYSQTGIVGTVTIDQARRLGINVPTPTSTLTPISQIPNPILQFKNIESDKGNDGTSYVLYRLTIENRNAFPDELFEHTPDLPPCGLNTNASRTWVYIYDAKDNRYIYGFCGYSFSQDLDSIMFNVRVSETPPDAVYVQLIDRKENKIYLSNTVTLPKDSTLNTGLGIKTTSPITSRPISTVSSITTSADQKTITNSIGMEFVQIPAGEFDMGSPSSEKGRYDDREGPIHRVKIAKAFYMGKYMVTQKQWRDIMGTNPSYFKGDNLPIDDVEWNDVQEFIRKLNGNEGNNKYRLPSESEWEYAARAGTTTRYFFGDDESELGEYAWYKDNSEDKVHDVGLKKPNPWGLYDMYGDVWEWVQDTFHYGYIDAPTDGSAWESVDVSLRVSKGGAWVNDAEVLRSAVRTGSGPGHNAMPDNSREVLSGFRLARDL